MTRITLDPTTPSPSKGDGAPTTDPPSAVTILILGLGWTSTFLCPLLEQKKITYAGTTRDGRNSSIPFTFNPSTREPSNADFKPLPNAQLVLITFPVRGAEAIKVLTAMYFLTHPDVAPEVKFVLLGSTGMWKAIGWNDETSPYDPSSERAQAEDALLESCDTRACVLDLAGLYGGDRHPRNWLGRVAKSKADVKGKGALHLVHGEDVARAVVLCWEKWEGVKGKRWILTDTWGYDWWGWFAQWGAHAREEKSKDDKEGAEGLMYEKWVAELMQEEGVRSLPRDKAMLGRLMDGRAFWGSVGSWPSVGRVS